MCLHQCDASRFEIKQKECSALLQKCMNKERIFLSQIHYLTISKATSVHACMNLECGITQHPGIKEILIRLYAEYSATYNFKIALMYNE